MTEEKEARLKVLVVKAVKTPAEEVELKALQDEKAKEVAEK